MPVGKRSLKIPETPASNPPKTHFNSYVSAFRKFAGITGISYLREPDLGILHIEASDWESFYQRPLKQAEQIPASILETWGTYVSDSSRDLKERLFAWPFRVAVSGLRWGGLLNTAPPTTVLMKEGVV